MARGGGADRACQEGTGNCGSTIPARAHRGGADGVEDDGALAGHDVKRDVHASDGCQDVREKDDAIRLESTPRLQRHLNSDVHVLRALAEGLVGLA